MHVNLRCNEEQPLSALVIRAEPGLPVLIDGKRMGQTDAGGTEHLLLRAIPGTLLHVALDTSRSPDLLPQHPVTSFEVGTRDQLLFVDQAFERRAEPRPRRRRAAPPPPPPKPSIPQRIH